jgi:hypothetical protein
MVKLASNTGRQLNLLWVAVTVVIDSDFPNDRFGAIIPHLRSRIKFFIIKTKKSSPIENWRTLQAQTRLLRQ